MTKKQLSKSETRIIGKLTVLLFIFAATSIQAQIPRFLDPSLFSGSYGVNAVTVADLNADGIADVASCNSYDPGYINIFLGNGDGTLGQALIYKSGTAPSDIAAADFNGDGKLDLVEADYGATFDGFLGDETAGKAGGNVVSILLGNGDGTFQNRRTYPANIHPNSVAVADFDHDGKLDLAVANDTTKKGSLSVLFGNGDGTFAAPIVYVTAIQARAVVAGDFNGDGTIDLAVAAELGNAVSILLGNGDGTFQTHQDLAAEGANLVSAADFNGDSKLDLVVTGYYESTFNVFLGNGDGTFQSPIQQTTTARGAFAQAVGDLDGD